MKRLKRVIFSLLGKDPEAVVVSFWTGEDELALRMIREIGELVPDRRHYVVTAGPAPPVPGSTRIELAPGDLYLQLRRALRGKRIGLAPVLFNGAPHPLRTAAICLAPSKILAYNRNLERHHLRPSIASILFLRGVPLDRIFLRPGWLCPWKKDRTKIPDDVRVTEGRALDPSRRRVAIVSPYFPYPLAHGGAVRIFNLLKEASAEFDIFLFAFAKDPAAQEYGPVMEFCAKAVVGSPPYYREPRWSTLEPPETHEFRSGPMLRELARYCAEYSIDLLQIEYTQLADVGQDVILRPVANRPSAGGANVAAGADCQSARRMPSCPTILVEHDITHDLYRQVYERAPSLSSWWDHYRWKRFESRAVRRFDRVVTMSAKDSQLLGVPNTVVIENGVDLTRFQPEPEPAGQNLLFVGSFNHFPNVEAFRFFHDQVWPSLHRRFPALQWTVVAGRDHALYWRRFTNRETPPSGCGIHLLDFVRDVRPLYAACNLVIVPTTVSAGTNLKVLEAMAMQRAVVSTACGCAGLGLTHGESVWIADDAEGLIDGVAWLLDQAAERARLARAARAIAERDFDWRRIGEKQRALYRELFRERKVTC